MVARRRRFVTTKDRPRVSTRRTQSRIAEFYPFDSKRHLNAVRRAADAVVKEARRSGALIPQPCEICGSRPSKSEAHHEDYTKPMEVRWLCRYHHRQRDAQLREERRRMVREQLDAALPVPHAQLARPQAIVGPSVSAVRQPVEPKRHSFLRTYEAFDLIRAATEAVSTQMDAQHLAETTLARRLRISRQMVNLQFAAGIRSLKTLAAYAEALGCDVQIVLQRREQEKSA